MRGRVTVNMRRARRRRSRLFRSDPTRPSCRAERGERGRAETASPSRAPAARGLRDPHPASAPRLPRDRCGNLRASTTTAHEQRREHAVHVTGTTRSPASLERVISPGSRHASAHLLDRRTWCVAREPCGAAAHTSRHNSYTCPMTSPEKWSTQGHTVRFFQPRQVGFAVTRRCGMGDVSEMCPR